MTNYQRGYAFELRVMKKLEEYGYFCVASRGSHGPADIVAIKNGSALLIQCKRNGVISKEDWEELWLLSLNLNCSAYVYFTPKRGVIEFVPVGEEYLPPKVSRGGVKNEQDTHTSSLSSKLRGNKKSTRSSGEQLQPGNPCFLHCD